MMRKLAVVADYLNDSHRAHIEKMAGDAGFTVDYFTEGHLPQDRAGEYEVIYGTVPPQGAEGCHGPAVVLLRLCRHGSVEGRCPVPQPGGDALQLLRSLRRDHQ